MKRREFITLVGGVAAAWPLVAIAQESMRRVGVLLVYPESDPDGQTRLRLFRQGLQELGWIEGRNIRIDYRWGAGDADRRARAGGSLSGCDPLQRHTGNGSTAASNK